MTLAVIQNKISIRLTPDHSDPLPFEESTILSVAAETGMSDTMIMIINRFGRGGSSFLAHFSRSLACSLSL